MMKIHYSVCAVCCAVFLVSAHEDIKKRDAIDDDEAFDKAQAEFQSIIRKADEPFEPLADPLKDIEKKELTAVSNTSSRPTPSHLPRNSTSSFVIDAASLAEITDQNAKDEVLGYASDDEDNNGSGSESEEDTESKTAELSWGRVPAHSLESSLVADSSREGQEHRRRGVSDLPIPGPTFENAPVPTETTTTTGRYPISYKNTGKSASKYEFKIKHVIWPKIQEPRLMDRVWSYDHPMYWHQKKQDGQPGVCDGRRRENARRRVCKLAHRRRRNHRRRRRHHRRRAHEYRRRRRRVHRRRRNTQRDSGHRRRSHRRRLERGVDGKVNLKNRRKKKEAGNKGPSTDKEKQLLGAALNAESLMQKGSSVVMDWNKGSRQARVHSGSAVTLDGEVMNDQGGGVLMRRHNDDS